MLEKKTDHYEVCPAVTQNPTPTLFDAMAAPLR
jgi:hypothetical protein